MAEKLYGTKDVAEILRIPEWRVKNFAEGSAYQLPPSQHLGKGHGSRRLYDAVGILRVAIATELVSFGFMPDAVGSAMGKVSEEEVLKISSEVRSSKAGENWRVLICIGCRWDLKRADQATRELTKTVNEDKGWQGVFAFNVSKLVACVQKEIEEYTNRSTE